MSDSTKPIRLQKRIADLGFCSRRKAEEFMEAGKVKVNGKVVTEMGTKVLPSDRIEVKGKKLKERERVTIALNKPAGVITTKSDPYHSKTVMSLLPSEWQHLKPAGRLDKESEGLLILSSDGELIQKLTHPKHGHTKTYEVLLKGFAKAEDLDILRSGKLKLKGYTLNPMDFEMMGTLKGRKTRIRLKLDEGRKRQIRRIMDQIGFPVIYLKRIAIGQFPLDGIESGQYKELTAKDIQRLLA